MTTRLFCSVCVPSERARRVRVLLLDAAHTTQLHTLVQSVCVCVYVFCVFGLLFVVLFVERARAHNSFQVRLLSLCRSCNIIGSTTNVHQNATYMAYTEYMYVVYIYIGRCITLAGDKSFRLKRTKSNGFCFIVSSLCCWHMSVFLCVCAGTYSRMHGYTYKQSCWVWVVVLLKHFFYYVIISPHHHHHRRRPSASSFASRIPRRRQVERARTTGRTTRNIIRIRILIP